MPADESVRGIHHPDLFVSSLSLTAPTVKPCRCAIYEASSV